MKRQKNDPRIQTRVYSYGTVPARVAPVAGEAEAISQMKLGRRLWNVLVTIERHRTAGYRRVMADAEQEEIDQLRARKDALWTEKKARRQKARTRIPTPDLDDELKRISAALHILVEHRNQTKSARHEERKEQLAALNLRAFQRIKRARQAAARMGLFWGTYNAVVQSADAGQKIGQLKYRGFRGEGTVTAQIIGGTSVPQCIDGSHTFFQIDPAVDSRKWRLARVRIGSTTGRAPLWVALPIVYHREIPPEARIKSVSATRRMVAGKPRWRLNVTVNLPQAPAKQEGGVIAIDIGWRLLPHGERVGYWQDDQGRHGERVVGLYDLDGLRKVADLRSITDQARDAFVPGLVGFLSGRELTEEWRERASRLNQWRSGDRIAALIRWWSDHRLEGDEQIFAGAIEWRKQYLHLTDWWRNQQDQITTRIHEEHRVFAASVARQYRVVILEDFDLRAVVETSKKDEQKTGGSTYRQMVSPSIFRSSLVNACKREGVEVRIVSGAYSTATCHVCHLVEEWDHAASVIHRCGFCGALWDQDHNAAINLLASGLEPRAENQQDSPGILPPPGDRSQTARKEAIEATA